MEVQHILGYFGALLIGAVLGMLGGGGSILTVPVLVYLFSLNPVTATAYSLFVVGVASLSSVIRNFKRQLITYRVGIIFALPSFIAVYLTRKYLIPAIPDVLIDMGIFKLHKEMAIMLFFGIIMIYVAYTMIKQKVTVSKSSDVQTHNYPILAFQGLMVGVLTGIIGAGGGFLIIPALVLLAKLSMKQAVATSLFIIMIKSLIGFIGDVENIEIDWSFLLKFTGVSVIGIMIGINVSKLIDGPRLKRIFGWFVLTMGIIIIALEILYHNVTIVT